MFHSFHAGNVPAGKVTAIGETIGTAFAGANKAATHTYPAITMPAAMTAAAAICRGRPLQRRDGPEESDSGVAELCRGRYRRLVVARVVQTRGELDGYCRAVPGAEVLVCQLVASVRTLRQRIGRREAGTSLRPLLRRAFELAQLLEQGDVADFDVQTDDRALADIAVEILRKAGWITE